MRPAVTVWDDEKLHGKSAGCSKNILCNLAVEAGAVGGKLLGAGGGGFLLFYVPEEKQQQVKNAIGLPQMPMAFDRQGTAVIYVGDKPDFI